MRILLLAGLMLAAGCGMKEEADRAQAYRDLRFLAEKSAIENCIKAGGAVVFSSWNDTFKDCKKIK